MYQVTQLPNGLRLATVEMPQMASVSLGIWAAVGSRCENKPENGISHFLEHMLFKGTKRRSAAQISREVEGIGGYINACTSEEHTCYHARAHASQAATLTDVLSDMYLNPVFDRREITRERSVIKEEIAMTYDQPSQHVLELSDETLWPNQPLGRSIAGTERSLNRTRQRELAGFLTLWRSLMLQIDVQSCRQKASGKKPRSATQPARPHNFLLFSELSARCQTNENQARRIFGRRCVRMTRSVGGQH